MLGSIDLKAFIKKKNDKIKLNTFIIREKNIYTHTNIKPEHNI